MTQLNIQALSKMLLLSIIIVLYGCEGKSSVSSINNNSTTAELSSNILAEPTANLPSRTIDHLSDNEMHVMAEDECYVDPKESAINQCHLYEYAYAANGNKIAMFKVGSNGQLQGLGAVTSGLPESASISSITVSPNTHNVYATVKNGSNDDQIFMLSIGIGDGILKPLATALISTHQTGISSIVVSNDSRYAYVTDASQICSYEIDEESGDLNNKVCQTPKIGNQTYAPYHQILLSSSNQYAYVMGGTNHNVLLMFKRESTTRELSLIESRGMGNNTRDIYIPDSRKYLYTARTDNKSVGQYGINPDTGVVKPLSPETVNSGMEPHTVAAPRSGKYVYAANYYSNSISMYSSESQTGKLSILSPESIATLTNPDKIMVDPTGSWVYVSTTHGQIAQYSINRDTGVLTPLSPSSVSVSPTVGEITFARIVRRHVFPLVPDNDERMGLEESATITIGCDNTVDCSALTVTMSETESHIGEIHVGPNPDEVNASSVDFGTVLPVDFDIVYKSPKEFKLDPVNLDEGRIVLLTVDGMDKYSQLIHQVIQYTSKSTTIVIAAPSDLNNVPVDAVFTIQYPYPISESIVNDSNFYLTKEGSTEHIPAHIIIQACGEHATPVFMCCCRNLMTNCENYCSSSASLSTDSNFEPNSDYYLFTNGVATATKVRTAKEETSGLIIYVAINTHNFEFDGDLSYYDPNKIEHQDGSYTGNSISGADHICNTDHVKPLWHFGSGVYKAMIFAAGVDGEERFACIPGVVWGATCGTQYSQDWVMFSGLKYITHNKMLIAYATPDAILPDRLVSPIDSRLRDVWTGATHNWTVSSRTCNSWHDSTDAVLGRYGMALEDAMQLYLQFPGVDEHCSNTKGVYCVEQP